MLKPKLSHYIKKFSLEDYLITPISSEQGMVSFSYRINKDSKTLFILKICPREEDFKRELYFLKLFEGKIPVPKIIHSIPKKEDKFPALLLEALAGETLQPSNMNKVNAKQLGAYLAKIHSQATDDFGDLTKPESLTKDVKEPFVTKFQEGLDECKDHLPKELLDFCEDFLNKNLPRLESCDGPCIIHRDFRPDNILMNEGHITGIIDWSSARSSFAEDDFCPIELGEWQISEELKRSFLEGYQSIRPLPNYQKIMPLLKIHRALAVVGFTVKKGTWDNVNSEVYLRNRKYLEAVSRQSLSSNA